MKRISVIIPVYNNEKYLDQCIRSVLSQTMKADEIIIIDDGSTDSSPQKCDQYALENDSITVIHKKNEGLGFARNAGMYEATSEYVMFLDSDDYIKENMLETLYNASEDGMYDIVKSGFIRIDLEGHTCKGRRYLEEESFREKEISDKMVKRMLGSLPDKHDSIEMGVTCSLLRRSIIIQNEIRFPSEREWISEDLIFNLELLSHIRSVKVIPYEGYFYRTNPNSLTVKFKENRFNEVCKLYRYVNDIIAKKEMDEEAYVRWSKTFIINLWMCIMQEKGMNLKESDLRIKELCDNRTVREMICSYPVHQLGKKQQLFVYLIKYRLSKMLWMLAQRVG